MFQAYYEHLNIWKVVYATMKQYIESWDKRWLDGELVTNFTWCQKPFLMFVNKKKQI